MELLTAPVLVTEAFGPVWQGEGPFAGRICGFLRLGQCNLACSWCDTPYSWDWKNYDRHSLEEWSESMVAEFCSFYSFIVLTGGEPLIHHRNSSLINGIRRALPTLHLETNGTIVPCAEFDELVDFYNISPKLFFQGDGADRRLKDRAISFFREQAVAKRASFKVVVDTEEQVDEAFLWYEHHNIPPESRWIMPLGTTREQIALTAVRLSRRILQHELNLTLRQQVILYDDERGV